MVTGSGELFFSLGKDFAIHLNRLETASSKDNLYQVWLKLAQWFWRKSVK
jgi:hypothetical protein